MDQPLPLDDLRVVELGQLLAGPFCGQLLGDFGAEVIKVEDPGTGDPMRQWGREKPYGKSLWWPVVARNKLSVTANLRTAEGQDLVRRLVGQADVLIENFRPGTLERWGLAPEELWKINPGLVVTRVTGFGQTGPYAERAGYGSIGEAMGGIRYVTGDPDRPPARAGISLGDSLAATFACLGTLVALHQRGRTGQGQVVDSAIYEAVLAMMESLVPEYQVAGYQRERTGTTLPNVSPSNVYPTSDGEMVLIAANQDTVFRRLVAAMQRPDLAEDERYATHGARGQWMEQLDGVIAEWSTTLAADDLLETLHTHGVPCRSDLPGQGHVQRPALRGPRGDRPAGPPRARRVRHAQRRSATLRDPRPRPPRRARARRTQRHVYRDLLGLDDDTLLLRLTASGVHPEEEPMTYRLGVDVGGTFTDILLIDEATGRTHRAKTSSTPEDQSVGVLRGIERVCESAGVDGGRDRRGLPRHHRGHQRDPGEQGRPGRPGHHRRLPAGAADRAVLRPRWPGRLDHLAQARAAGGAGGHRRGARADRQRRRRSSASSTRTTSAPS